MYNPGTECEEIDGNMYYYLKISGKYNVYVYAKGSMNIINMNLPSLLDAKSFAQHFAKIYKEECVK
jgi:hypothetical protein